jgi:OmpA-OmpF porin, OOP family
MFTNTFKFLSLCMLLAITATADISGSKDHPLLKRYEGSSIIKYSDGKYDEYVLPTGPATGDFKESRLSKSITVEGTLTRITYLLPETRTAVEAIRNYESDLRESGFTILFQNGGKALGNTVQRKTFATAAGYDNIRLNQMATMADIVQLGEEEDRFLAAKLDRPEGAVHVAVYAITISPAALNGFALSRMARANQVLVQVDIVESKPMETKMVTVTASEMATSIERQGSIALYGIFFDTDSDEVKEQSLPTIEQIAKLLRDQAKLKLLVVGHTDRMGTFDYNMDLSKRRAASVVELLAGQHGIDRKRLTPVGVSYAAPVATNKTADGRAKNRRVQLVED